MRRLGILHIADLHFGYSPEVERIKKAPISEGLKRELSGDDPRVIFLRKMLDLLGDQQVDLLAFTGDAGIAKNLETIRNGLGYLSEIRDRLNLSEDRVIVSPGNHDLDREATNQQELAMFFQECNAKKFVIPARQQAVQLIVNGIPVIAINTCLGGTEVAFYALPENLKERITALLAGFSQLSGEMTADIPEKVRSQLDEMDIPAIGNSQLDSITECLRGSTGNCAIVLGHHMLLPTQMLIVRPYAEIVDGGQLMFSLMGSERRILYLHGHAHCDSAIVVRAPDEIDSGFIACLGGNGLHRIPTGASASASYVQVLADDNSDFLVAIVSRFQQKGMSFSKSRSFAIWDEGVRISGPSIKIDAFTPGTTLSFDEIVELLSVTDTDKLATDLLRRRSVRQIEIDDFEKPPSYWRIMRNV